MRQGRLTSGRGAVALGAIAVLALGLIALLIASNPDGAATADAKPCTASPAKPVRSPAYADTPWPTEHADAWRTHAAPTGLPADLGRVRLATKSVRMPLEPVWGYAGRGGKIYVVGGSPYLLNMFTELMLGAPKRRIPLLVERTRIASTRTTPYVARIDARTMALEKVLRLRDGKGGFVNYTGGLLVHSNGFLYAVAQGYLYKVDPGSFAIVDRTALPAAPAAGGGPNKMTTYNGIAAAANGDLFLKGWASSGGEGEEPPGMLLRVDPGSLAIKPDPPLPVSGISSARMALVSRGGAEYLYLPGPKKSVRFAVDGASFKLDDGWTSTYYGKGDTQASSDLFMGNGVVFANNTSPTAKTSSRLFAKGIAAGSPLREYRPFKHPRKVGWNFFMVAGDPYRSGVVAVGDQATGRVSGFRACAGGAGARKLWENDRIRSSAGMAINYKAGHLYTDDRDCKQRRCRLYLVVLDLRTGRELARVPVRGTKPSMGQIFIARNAVFYVATQTGTPHGYVTRITAR